MPLTPQSVDALRVLHRDALGVELSADEAWEAALTLDALARLLVDLTEPAVQGAVDNSP